MAQPELLQRFSLGRFNNPEFINLATRFVLHVDEAGIGKLGIDEAEYDAFKADLAAMVELSLQSTASVETARMRALDAERDDLLRYLYPQIRNSRKAPLPAQREAALLLYPVVKPYRDIYRSPAQQETQLIRGLLHDLRKPEAAAAVATLGLTVALDRLEQQNNAYEMLAQQRTNNAAASTITENSTAIRRRMEVAYRYMEAKGQAWSIARPSAEASRFVKQLNQTIRELVALNRLRLASRKVKQPVEVVENLDT